jgi:hypothetical protein
MTDDPDLAQLEAALARLRQRPARRTWIDDFHAGEMLLSGEAAEIGACNAETIRRRCEAAALTSRPIGVLIASSVWLISREALLDYIELHHGKPAMLAAKSRAEKITDRGRRHNKTSAA